MIKKFRKKLITPILGLSLLAQSANAAYNPFTPDAIKVVNTALANANTSTSDTQFNNFNTTPTTNTSTDVFTSVDSDGVNCIAGTYLVDAVLYQDSSSSSRNNVSVEITVDGVGTGVIGASAYTRRADGHNEASAIVSDTVTLTGPAKIGFVYRRLANGGVVAIPVGQSAMRIVRMKD